MTKTALVLLLILATGAAARGIPAVLLSDIGMDIDDQWALAHLATSPDVDLRGIVTSHAANLPAPASEITARAARAEVEALHLGRHVPVIAGAPAGLARFPHGSPGSAFIRQQARRMPAGQRLAVLLIGPATDLASALVEEPELAERVRLIAMAFKHVGTGANSWNIRQDVAAWQIVVQSACPITIGCDDVCVRDLSLTVPRARALVGGHGAISEHLVDMLERNLAAQGPKEAQRLSGRPDAWPVWDEVVTAVLLGATTQHEWPRLTLKDDQLFDFQRPIAGSPISWVTRIDAPKLWADLVRCVQRDR